jgi:uncharacterized protein YggU (UPF0235/DUF167 family)
LRAPSEPLHPDDEATLLFVRLTPRGGRDALEPARLLADGSCILPARVRAAPEGGQANKALLMLVAQALDCAKGAVSLVSGATSRLKTVRVEKAYPEVKASLRALLLL